MRPYQQKARRRGEEMQGKVTRKPERAGREVEGEPDDVDVMCHNKENIVNGRRRKGVNPTNATGKHEGQRWRKGRLPVVPVKVMKQ